MVVLLLHFGSMIQVWIKRVTEKKKNKKTHIYLNICLIYLYSKWLSLEDCKLNYCSNLSLGFLKVLSNHCTCKGNKSQQHLWGKWSSLMWNLCLSPGWVQGLAGPGLCCSQGSFRAPSPWHQGCPGAFIPWARSAFCPQGCSQTKPLKIWDLKSEFWLFGVLSQHCWVGSAGVHSVWNSWAFWALWHHFFENPRAQNVCSWNFSPLLCQAVVAGTLWLRHIFGL